MKYCIRALRHGRVYEAFADGFETAMVFYEAMENAGFEPEIWRGSELLWPGKSGERIR